MNRRVWVTRDEEWGGEGTLSSALLAAGLEPVLEPVLERRIVGDALAMVDGLGEGDWLVLTSAFGARALGRCAGPHPFAVAAVGEATARELRSQGYDVHLIAPERSGASLWPALWKHAKPGTIVRYPRSTLAEVPTAPEGVRLESPVLYETAPRAFDAGVAFAVAAVAVASPSAAERIAPINGLPPCASIGPTTSAAMRSLGIPVWLESREHTFEDLASCIAAALAR